MFAEKNEITLLIFALPAISMFIYALALTVGAPRSQAKMALARMFLVIGALMGAYCVFDYFLYDPPYTINSFFDVWSGLVAAPMVLYYFTALMRPDVDNNKLLAFNLIPAMVMLGAYLIVTSIWGAVPDTRNLHDYIASVMNFEPGPLVRAVALLVFICEAICYILRIRRMARWHSRRIRNDYSYREDINMNWVSTMLLLLLLYGAMTAFTLLNPWFVYRVIFAMVSFVIGLLVFVLGVAQRELPELRPVTVQAGGNGRGALSRARTEELKEKLLVYFAQQKPYLNPDLDLTAIALELHTNRTYISNLINGQFGTTFYLFVNRYRIRHALPMLEKGDYAIDVIVSESGFKSRSGFYRIFRDEMGCTPTEYVTRIKKMNVRPADDDSEQI